MTQSGQPSKQLILIVARPGPLSDGLVALLSALSQADQVLQAADPTAALDLAAANRPHLVIVDAAVADKTLLDLLRALRPLANYSLVLADDVRQTKLIEPAGADAVILKGIAATEMIALVEGLLEKRRPD
jgi:DNA-binding NarL/FixJ family response regulator